MVTLSIYFSGEIRDYLVVEYLDGKLSVPADQLGSLGRYRATDGKKPKGVKRRNDLINFDVDIPKLIRHLD